MTWLIIFPILTYSYILGLFLKHRLRIKTLYFLKWLSKTYLKGLISVTKQFLKALRGWILLGLIICIVIVYAIKTGDRTPSAKAINFDIGVMINMLLNYVINAFVWFVKLILNTSIYIVTEIMQLLLFARQPFK